MRRALTISRSFPLNRKSDRTSYFTICRRGFWLTPSCPFQFFYPSFSVDHKRRRFPSVWNTSAHLTGLCGFRFSSEVSPLARSPLFAAQREYTSFSPSSSSTLGRRSSTSGATQSAPTSPSPPEFLFEKKPIKRFVQKNMPPTAVITSSRSSGSWNTLAVFHAPGTPLMALELCLVIPGTPFEKTPLVKSLARESHTAAKLTLERIRLLLAPQTNNNTSNTGTNGTSPVAGKKMRGSAANSKEEKLKLCPQIKVLGDLRLAEMGKAANPSSNPSPSDNATSSITGGSAERAVEASPTEATSEDAPLEELDPEMKNETFWRCAKKLCILNTEIAVFYNRPLVLSISALPTPYVGSPLMCVDYKVMFAKDTDISYQWTHQNLETGEIRVLSEEPIFVPTPDLEFQVLTLRLSADPDQGMWTEMKTQRVKPAEEAMDRWKYTPSYVTPPLFRVVTYNVLYDGFCTNELGRKHIYPFCTEEMLDDHQRSLRIRRELMGYHADLICLQECGHKLFNQFYLPSFRVLGYDGWYANKSGTAREGCGCLYRKARFELLESSILPLNFDTLQTKHPQVAARVHPHAELLEAMRNMTAIGTAVRLRDRLTGKEMVIGNTHLFYHADGCHIRALQAYMQMHHLYEKARRRRGTCEPRNEEELKMTTATGPEDDDIVIDPILFCGDCNCTHSTAAYRLLTTGEVEAEHHSWEKGMLFWWGCDKKLGSAEEVEMDVNLAGLSRPRLPPPAPFGEAYFHEHLTAPFRFDDGYSYSSEPLPWTNYTRTFKEVIDYILFSHGRGEVEQAVPIPPEEELNANCALPNKKYASDHLALIVDMKWI